MILLTCIKIPEELDKNQLTQVAICAFPHPDNLGYIREIAERKNENASCEGLFALTVLQSLIPKLPCPPDQKSLRLRRAEGGKPYFADLPLHFNVSHSGGYVACALSDCDEVGVDIETSNPPDERAKKIAQRFFTKDEILAVEQDPKRFPRLWTEKEAKAKFSGESVGNLLYNEKNNTNFPEIQKILTHTFTKHNIPITLCTKKDYSTILFL